jgi:hypothetical protein
MHLIHVAVTCLMVVVSKWRVPRRISRRELRLMNPLFHRPLGVLAVLVTMMALGSCGQESESGSKIKLDSGSPQDTGTDQEVLDVDDADDVTTGDVSVIPVCGNGNCEEGEDADNCQEDCQTGLPEFFEKPCNSHDDCVSEDGAQFGYCVVIDELGHKACSIGCITSCPVGYGCTAIQNPGGSDYIFVCTKNLSTTCNSCENDNDCLEEGSKCIEIGQSNGETDLRCAVACSARGNCKDGFECKVFPQPDDQPLLTLCVPKTKSCICFGVDDEGNEINGSTNPCIKSNDFGTCEGLKMCNGGEGWSGCDALEPAPETCDDKIDNDCDGQIDEDCKPIKMIVTFVGTTVTGQTSADGEENGEPVYLLMSAGLSGPAGMSIAPDDQDLVIQWGHYHQP